MPPGEGVSEASQARGAENWQLCYWGQGGRQAGGEGSLETRAEGAGLWAPHVSRPNDCALDRVYTVPKPGTKGNSPISPYRAKSPLAKTDKNPCAFFHGLQR